MDPPKTRSGRHEKKYQSQVRHFCPLIEELVTALWDVHERPHAITVRIRATIPECNAEVVVALQVVEVLQVRDKRQRDELQIGRVG
eukprot:131211-Pyramimonas_sp.AAC.3